MAPPAHGERQPIGTKSPPTMALATATTAMFTRNAMTVFNGHLTLGVTNWASGVGVWQKTLTADFTATPDAWCRC